MTFAEVSEAARNLGFVATMDGGNRIVVGRDAEDWQMPDFTIAIGTEPAIYQRAVETLNKLAPQLRKKLQDDAPEQDQVGLAAGLSSDGTVTALRVERDGSVRLHPDDIEAIAAAVSRRLWAEPAMVHEGEFVVPQGYFTQGKP